MLSNTPSSSFKRANTFVRPRYTYAGFMPVIVSNTEFKSIGTGNLT